MSKSKQTNKHKLKQNKKNNNKNKNKKTKEEKLSIKSLSCKMTEMQMRPSGINMTRRHEFQEYFKGLFPPHHLGKILRHFLCKDF